MAIVAACRRWGQSRTHLRISRFSGLGISTSVYDSFFAFLALVRQLDCKHISEHVKSNGNRLFLVDTLALVRKLNGQCVPSKQAGAITITMNNSMKNVSRSFVSKAEMQKILMIQESILSKFKSKLQSSQEHHFFSLLQQETEKVQNDIEKMCSELRYEIDKATHTIMAYLESAIYDNTA